MSVAPADVRAAIVASLAAALPGLDIAAHGGNFSEAELQRFSIRAPAIRVCMTEISKIDYAVTGQIEVTLHLAIVLVAKDQAQAGSPTLDRDGAALNLVAAVLPLLNGQTFGLDNVSTPIGLGARNEFSGALDKTGIALWQITFAMLLRLGISAFDTTGEVLTALVVAGTPFAGTLGGVAVPPGAAPDAAVTAGVPHIVAPSPPDVPPVSIGAVP